MSNIDKEKQLSMPGLADLDSSLRGKRLLGRIMGVHGPPTARGLQIADGFVRLVEKTVVEYESVRRELLRFLTDGLLDNYFRAQDHFETCIQSLHRAILYLDQLRRLGFSRADGTPFVPRPRDLQVLNEGIRSRVRQLRDQSEHLDKDIINGRIPEDAEVAIHLGRQCARLAEIEICYEEMSIWIIQLHHFAALLSKVEVVVTVPGTDSHKENDP
jgi:hypothetical protein